MRKVEREMVAAIRAMKNRTIGNTSVTVERFVGSSKLITVRLHGNVIAEITTGLYEMMVTLAGWNTPTTRSRVNALLQAFSSATHAVRQRNFCAEFRTHGTNGDVWQEIGSRDRLNIPMVGAMNEEHAEHMRRAAQHAEERAAAGAAHAADLAAGKVQPQHGSSYGEG
jgi:hypothetical protein